MTPRYPDADVGALERCIAAATEALTHYPDVDDPRNYETYRTRASARYARGASARDVVDDLRLAGLCLKDRIGIRLHKMEVHRLKSRRLDPMHLAALHADPELVERVGEAAGLPLTTWYANAATPEVATEVRMMSPFFTTRRLDAAAHVVGLAAATWAAALGAMMRGDEKEAGAVLQMLSDAVADLSEEPPASGKRYLLQCAALTDVLARREDDLSRRLASLAPYARAERERATSVDAEAVRTRGLGAPDLVTPALTGVAILVNMEPDLGPLRQADPHLAALCGEVERAWSLVE